MKTGARLAAIRSALPDGTLDNDQLAREFEGWSADKIYAKTGIRTRHIARADECASDLAVTAADQLLLDTGIDRSSIDYLLFCTQSPDYQMPTTACLLQDRLGLPTSIGALDYNLGCSGYVYGLGLCKALIESNQAYNILLITADTYSKIVNPADKSVRTIFGDGATASLVVAGEQPNITGPFVYGTDGRGVNDIIVPASGARQRPDPNAPLLSDDSGNARTVNDLRMSGPEVFNFTLRIVPDVVQRLLAAALVTKDAVDLFVFHQANGFMLDHLRRKLEIPKEKFVVFLENIGNTVSSSIPFALQEAARTGKLKPNSLVMLVAFGVGFSWSATLLRFRDSDLSW